MTKPIAVQRDPDVLGGTAVFPGTRVPVRTLLDHLEAGDRLDDFLDDYPTVSKEAAVAVLEHLKGGLDGSDGEAAA